MKSKKTKVSTNKEKIEEVTSAINDIQNIVVEIQRNALETASLLGKFHELMAMAPLYFTTTTETTSELLSPFTAISRNSSPLYSFPQFGSSLLENYVDSSSEYHNQETLKLFIEEECNNDLNPSRKRARNACD